MTQKYILFVIILLPSVIFGQLYSNYSGGVGPAGIGNAGVSWTDEHASLNNQAGTIGIQNWAFVASAAQLFTLQELSILAAGITKRINKSSAISLSIKYFGDSDLNNQQIGLAYARKLFDAWDISLQADLIGYTAVGFGSRYLATVEIGSMIHASKKMDIGVHIFNPFSISLTEQQDIPAIFRLGTSYEVSSKVELYGEIQKEISEPVDLKLGIEYAIIDNFRWRIGLASLGRQLSTGFTYGFGGSSIHGAFSWHNQLGFTPGVSYAYKK